jgi:PmbA protein
MHGQKKTREICDRILSLSASDQTEVIYFGGERELTRFANSYIHQNVAETSATVSVRVVLGKKIGVAATNDLSAESLERVVEAAQEIARFQRENPGFVSLPEPASITSVDAYEDATASCTPEKRAKAVGVICRQATERGLVASGAFSTSVGEIAVANSLGVFGWHLSTTANLSTVIMSDDSAGYADQVAMDVSEIDADAVGQEAIGKALRSRAPVDLAPGQYTVILEEYAVAEMLDNLNYAGFGARAFQEGRSFMSGNLGKSLVGSNISIWDDGLDRRSLPMPFDFEGVPKQRVDFFEKGVARGVAYDSYTAGLEQRKSTGHGLPAPNTFGPLPGHLFMATGDSTKAEMLASTERGLWVTRFHYVNIVHPLHAVLTGMTRDGTFLIENGELTQPVKNLRFTQNILEALSRVEMIGRERKLEKSWVGGSVVPALKISAFEFTGATEF